MIEVSFSAEQPGDPTQDRPWSLRLRWYFWSSVAILAVNVAIIGWQPDAAPPWRESLAIALTMLIPAALFGLLAARARRAVYVRHAARSFFAKAVLVGALSVYCGHEIWELSHLDCGDSCVASVPTYAVLWWAAIVSAVPAVLVPAVLALVPSRAVRQS